jgi:hypothetical protein
MSYALILAIFASFLFILLALTEKKSLLVRSLYLFVGILLTLSLGFMFTSFERHGDYRGPGGMEKFTVGLPIVVETEKAMQLTVRGFGLWLVIVASGELLRLILKRPVGSELLGPAVLFLVGALLIEPYWVIGVPLSIALAGIVIVSVWGRKRE